jgi:menaquinone-dependent protoporphyrinogen IX oxidase
MKVLIVCQSESHGNTKKIGVVFSKHFNAALLEPDQVNLAELGQYDLIGFGSGIKYSNFYKKLRKFIDRNTLFIDNLGEFCSIKLVN